jgi:aminoacylase
MTIGAPARTAAALVLSTALGLLTYSGLLQSPLSHPPVTLPASAFPVSLFPAIGRLQAYLRIRTDHPHPDYYGAAAFLNATISELLPSAVVSQHELVRGKPILIATLAGADLTLPSVLLNSHTDVVPAETAKWHWDPFAADIAMVDYETRLYARGSQDMKSVGMQYLEALAVLSSAGWVPKRTIHVSFVPDEEIGGEDGMGALVGDGTGDLWTSLNVGAELDEGLPNPKNTGYNVYYGERQPWWLVVTAEDAPGHGALSPDSTAPMRIQQVMTRGLAFRASERQRMAAGDLDIGDVVGVNLVFMESGVKSDASPSGHSMNMIPSSARVGFDIRVPPQMAPADMDAEIDNWLQCDGTDKPCPGLSYKFVHKVEVPDVTARDGSFAIALEAGLREAGKASRPGVFFASTDARFVRALGVPSVGFSPMDVLPDLLHKHNEYIVPSSYLAGIKVYESVIGHLADVWPDESAHSNDAMEVVKLEL